MYCKCVGVLAIEEHLHVCECNDALAVILGRREQVLEDVGHPQAQLAGEALEDKMWVRLRHCTHLGLVSDVMSRHLSIILLSVSYH